MNRSKFSAATKKRIAACINRRGKALGCTPGKPAKAKGDFESLDLELKQFVDSEIFKTTKDLVEQSVNTPNMDLDFSDCEDCE